MESSDLFAVTDPDANAAGETGEQQESHRPSSSL
jgi:hypothetical protein